MSANLANYLIDESEFVFMAKNQLLSYKVERFDFFGVARFLVSHRARFEVPVTASLYEAYLYSRRKSKKGTSGLILQHLMFLYTWAESINFELERHLFSGVGLQLIEISDFANWLERRGSKERGLSDGYLAHIMGDCKTFVLWFVKRGVQPKESESLNVTIRETTLAHQDAWAECEIKVGVDLIAEDLSDSDYELIESNFRRGCFSPDELFSAALRNYLMWRLAWEFGLRIGEILALRVQDLHFNANPPFLSIVKLDDRDKDELDPRSPYQPKVKTLSRELGFLFPESPLIKLLDIYVSKSRYRDVMCNGKMLKSPFLTHDFLFVVHDGSGHALSCSAAQKISVHTAKETGVDYNWHLARHAFFNRRYIEASQIPDNAHLIDNLVYWGGWKSRDSLDRYTRRAIRDLARSGLLMRNRKFEPKAEV